MKHQPSRPEVVRKKRPREAKDIQGPIKIKMQNNAKHRGFAADGIAKRRGLHHSQSAYLHSMEYFREGSTG